MSKGTRHPLEKRRGRQIKFMPAAKRSHMASLTAMTARPVDSLLFPSSGIVPLGRSTMYFYSVHPAIAGSGTVCWLRGFTAQHRDDEIVWSNDVCSYDLSQPMRLHGNGSVIDPFRNPALADMALDMDSITMNVDHTHLSDRPPMPAMVVAFAPQSTPALTECEWLQQRLLKKLAFNSQERFEAVCGEETRARLLREELAAAVESAYAKTNETGFDLVSFDLVGPAQLAQAVGVFEDWRALLGVRTPNPVQRMGMGGNPAARVLAKAGVDLSPDTVSDVSQETHDELLAAMRLRLGPSSVCLSDDLIGGALLDPAQEDVFPPRDKVLEWGPVAPILAMMRSLVSASLRAYVTDDDLLAAAQNVYRPLRISGIPSVRVYRRYPGPLRYGRVVVDADAVRSAWSRQLFGGASHQVSHQSAGTAG